MTKKQKRFVEEYLVDLNATQAAIRAGYKPDTAYSIGAENLKKPEIACAVEKAMAERSRRTGITQDRVLRELARVAFVNSRDVINYDTASVKDDVDPDDTAAIQGVKVKITTGEKSDTVEREVRMADKLKALELLGKHLGMYKDKVEVSGLEEEKSKLDDLILQMRGDG